MFDPSNRIRPILKWAGGKSALLPQLLPHFPAQFERYFEPFLGGAAVFLTLRQGTPAVLNDFSLELVNLYQVLRDDPEGLMQSLDAHMPLYSEAYYYQVRASEPSEPVSRASRTVFLNKTGFNGLFRHNAAGKFNVPFGKRPRCPNLYHRANLLAASFRLQSADLYSGDFEKVLDEAGPGDFVYCDPPYAPLSTSSSFTGYHGGGFGIQEQKRLRDACRRAAGRGATVAISNSSAPAMLKLYADDRKHYISAPRSINSVGSGRGAVKELLVLLSPEGLGR